MAFTKLESDKYLVDKIYLQVLEETFCIINTITKNGHKYFHFFFTFSFFFVFLNPWKRIEEDQCRTKSMMMMVDEVLTMMH